MRQLKRKEYLVHDITAYQLPDLPEDYFWQLWVPDTPSPTVAYLEVRKKEFVASQFICSQQIAVSSGDVLKDRIVELALQMIVFHVLNVRVYEGHGDRILIPESYALWKEVYHQLPTPPAQCYWEVDCFHPDTVRMRLKKYILFSDDVRTVTERELMIDDGEALNIDDIIMAAEITLANLSVMS